MRATPCESMPRRSAHASTSAACSASSFGTSKCIKTRAQNSRSESMGKIFVSMSAMIFAIALQLGGQARATRFRTERNQQQADGERERSQRHRNSQRSVAVHTRADQERDARAAEPRKRSGKSKRAGAAFGWVLLRQPKRIDGEICATKP